MTSGTRILAVFVAGLLLPCAATAQARDAAALNVSISVFDPGIPADRALQRDLKVFPRIRKVEARFLPFVLRETLVSTGEWGAVRVVTGPDAAAEVGISGSIIRSDGERLEIRVRAVDATGRLWFDEVFGSSLVQGEHETDPGAAPGDPVIYDEIAASLRAARNRLDDRELARIIETSLLRYATELAPSAFGQYLSEDANGMFSIRRLPARNDPMLDRIERIRLTEYVITDSVDAKFRELHEEIASTYALWRQYRQKSLEYDRQNARRAEDTRSDAPRDSYEAIRNLYDNYKWDRVTVQEQDRLAIAFNNEVGPVVAAMEVRITELERWVDSKYAEWHRLLEELFEAETELNRAGLQERFRKRDPGAEDFAVREPLLHDLDELDIEAERLARKRVVCVDSDRIVGHGGHHELHGLPVGAAALQSHAFTGFEIVRQQAAIDFLDQLLMTWAVGVDRFDPNALAVADSHAFDGFVETGNDLAAADFELERIATCGRVELAAVVERAGVVNLYGVAGFCVAHLLRSKLG